jgi:hypothetical protein
MVPTGPVRKRAIPVVGPAEGTSSGIGSAANGMPSEITIVGGSTRPVLASKTKLAASGVVRRYHRPSEKIPAIGLCVLASATSHSAVPPMMTISPTAPMVSLGGTTVRPTCIFPAGRRLRTGGSAVGYCPGGSGIAIVGTLAGRDASAGVLVPVSGGVPPATPPAVDLACDGVTSSASGWVRSPGWLHAHSFLEKL